MDLSKLTLSDKVIAGSGIALLIFSFLPWYGKGGYSESGWSYFLWGIIPALLAIALVALVAVKNFASNVKLPEAPYGLIFLGGAGLAALLVILKLLIGQKYGGFGFSVSLERKFGLFLAVLASIGLVAGAFLKFQAGEETTTSSSGGGNTPPTPF